MRRSGLGPWFLSRIAAVAAGVAGCGGEPVAIPPDLAASTSNPGAAARSPVVFVILPAPPNARPEYISWVMAAERVGRNRRAIVRVLGPAPGETSSGQAALVGQALKGGGSGIVVVPADDAPGINEALADAEKRGVPVVTLGAAVPEQPPRPGTAVVPEAFGETAPKLVRAVADDARKGTSEGGPPVAALLFDRKGDWFAAARLEALRKAAAEAGFARVEEVGYEAEKTADGRVTALAALTAALDAHPEIRAVIAEGDEALAAADRARTSRKPGQPPIWVAGYLGYRGDLNPEDFRGNSAFVEGRFDLLAEVAVQIALDRAEGGRSEPVRVVPTPFNRALGGARLDREMRPIPAGEPEPKPAPGTPVPTLPKKPSGAQ